MVRRVLVDCPEEIPCNPCEYACKFGAIVVGEDITAIPQVNPELCTGCNRCIVACPGQACFVVDLDYTANEASVDIPYEYLPLPVVGQEVKAKNNEGEVVCKGRVEKVMVSPRNDHTPVIRLAVPKEKALEVRAMGFI